jgi:hypothetical protein
MTKPRIRPSTTSNTATSVLGASMVTFALHEGRVLACVRDMVRSLGYRQEGAGAMLRCCGVKKPIKLGQSYYVSKRQASKMLKFFEDGTYSKNVPELRNLLKGSFPKETRKRSKPAAEPVPKAAGQQCPVYEDLAELQAAIDGRWVTMAGYCNMRKLKLNTKERGTHGRVVADCLRGFGYTKELEDRKVPNERFGYSNLYPVAFLDAYFEGLKQ